MKNYSAEENPTESLTQTSTPKLEMTNEVTVSHKLDSLTGLEDTLWELNENIIQKVEIASKFP